MTALALQGDERGGLGMLGCVLDTIHAEAIGDSSPRHKRPVTLFGYHRDPAVVVYGLPN